MKNNPVYKVNYFDRLTGKIRIKETNVKPKDPGFIYKSSPTKPLSILIRRGVKIYFEKAVNKDVSRDVYSIWVKRQDEGNPGETIFRGTFPTQKDLTSFYNAFLMNRKVLGALVNGSPKTVKRAKNFSKVAMARYFSEKATTPPKKLKPTTKSTSKGLLW